jgi:DNA-binding protein Fis
VRPGGDPSAPDVLLADPHVVADGGLESVIAARAASLLSRLGDAVPALHETVMGQTERGLFKAVLCHTRNHLGRASKILGLDRKHLRPQGARVRPGGRAVARAQAGGQARPRQGVQARAPRRAPRG